MRHIPLFILPLLLSACVSFNRSQAPEAPDFVAVCEGKEAQCKEICGSAGIQVFSCKAAPREGMEYKCECRKPPGQNI